MLHITSDMYNAMQYNGSEPKCGVTVDGVRYVLKRQKRDWNNVLCEHIASSLINILGGDAHCTQLAQEGDSVVVLCRDFTQDFTDFTTLQSISTSSFDTDTNAHEYYFSDVQHLLKSLHGVNAEKTIHQFLQMFVFDTILGNPDRHSGNWGVCKRGNERCLAPIFDNGACLFPRASYASLNKEWLAERIKVWPNSKIMFDSRKRASYYEVWGGELPDYALAFAHGLELNKAVNWIYEQPYLSDEAKWFYTAILEYRYRVIIKRERLSWI